MIGKLQGYFVVYEIGFRSAGKCHRGDPGSDAWDVRARKDSDFGQGLPGLSFHKPPPTPSAPGPSCHTTCHLRSPFIWLAFSKLSLQMVEPVSPW
jgi:hypothetical protein